MGYLRKECSTCHYWKKLGEHCGAIMHGMKCIAGPLTVEPGAAVPLPEGEKPDGQYARNLGIELSRVVTANAVSPEGVAVSALYGPRPAFTTEQMLDEAIACAEKGQARMATYEAQMHKGKDTRGPENGKDSNPKDIVGTRKAPMSTVSAAVMAEVGVAMLEGALKYGRHNYRAVGVRASVYYDACLRHMFAWWDMGEDIDPASKLSHITKAIAGLMVLRDSMLQGNWVDDRPPPCPEFYEALNAAAAKLVDSAPSPAPKHYTAVNTAIDKAGLGDSHDALTFGEIRP